MPPDRGEGDRIVEALVQRREAGLDPKTLPITVYGVKDDADTLKRYRYAGIHAVILALKAAKADETLPILDKFAATMRGV